MVSKPNGFELCGAQRSIQTDSRPARYYANISRFSIKNLLFQIAQSAGSADEDPSDFLGQRMVRALQSARLS